MGSHNPVIIPFGAHAPAHDSTEASEEPAVDRSSAISLRTYALAAVASHLYGSASSVDETPEVRYLLYHAAAVDPNRTGWAPTLPEYLRQPAPVDIPLIRLAQELGLTTIEILTVALAAAVEDDVMVGRTLAHLQNPLGGSRPTLGLLSAALSGVDNGRARPIDLLVTGVAVQSGLLALLNEGAPLPERAISVPLHLSLALNGYDGSLPGTTIGLGNIPEVPLSSSIAEEARRQAIGLSASQRALVLRTGSTAEGRSVAAELAGAMQQRALFIETDRLAGLSPWLILRHLLPVFCFSLAPGERKTLPPLPFYNGPILALCGPDGSVEMAGTAALSWSLPVPPREELHELWQIALGNDELAADLARHHRHSTGRIAHLGRLARHQAILKGYSQPTAEEVRVASWNGEEAGLDALAQPITSAIHDEALVMTQGLRNELNTLFLRCRARDSLVRGLGASATARYYPGVRALFVGPSGTGKTLAAGWLATKLGLPLYRVDLASVTS